jgi:hypothetical protein
MSRTVIVTLDAIETITKMAEVVVRVPDTISSEEIIELVMSINLDSHPCADWQNDYQDFEVHAAYVTEQIEVCGKPDVVIKRIGERFEARVNQ